MLHFAALFHDRLPEEGPHPVLARLADHPDYVRPDEKAEPLFFVPFRDADDG